MVISNGVQQIKERLSIEEVVSSYMKLQKAGKNWKAKCPFHNEKTPSFFVSPERGGYYCFGCGAKGDIFTFVEEFEGLDFRGALKVLAERAGVPLSSWNPKEESEKEQLYQIMETAAKYFEANLVKSQEAQKYLALRGLLPETIKSFRLGFALPEWRGLYEHLQPSFSTAVMEQAGLIKKNEEGSLPAGRQGHYDRFRSRIMFPIGDSSGRIIAFSGRIFGEGEPKYLNSPDTPIFQKSFVLYGLDKAKDSIRKNNFSVLVEGQMDLILSHQAGFKNTVAASGTALSDAVYSEDNVISNFGLIRRLSSNIVFAFDADRAGIDAAGRATRIALALGMDVKIAAMPEGEDPALLITKEGSEAWRAAIRGSKHIIEFLLEKILKSSSGSRQTGKEVKEKLLPYVDAVESSIEKVYFLKKISEATGIPEKALEADLQKIEKQSESEGRRLESDEAKPHRREHILRRLLGIIFWQKTLANPALNLEEISHEIAETLHLSPGQAEKEAAADAADLIFQAEIFYNGTADLPKDAQELLANLREEHLREELAQKMKELQSAEKSQDRALSAKLLKECQLVSQKIETVKNSRLKVSQ